ncbi:MAG: hypothetical protein ACRDPM_10900 [Solirubrobacteraceae bacterium]
MNPVFILPLHPSGTWMHWLVTVTASSDSLTAAPPSKKALT